ncbi:MAG: GGDEF domain-containing response regulator [Blautia sp.]|nr:GGDEF domain-containing response regulator [Blautia sp.]
MRKIIAVDNSTKHIQVLSEILGRSCHIIQAGNTEEALKIIGGGNDRLSLVLLNIDEFPLEGISFLKKLNTRYMLYTIPVVVITEDVERSNIQEAYEAGAEDYISLDMHEVLIRQRIHRIAESAERDNTANIEALMDSGQRNHFLFHNCIGAALIMETDGEQIRALMINDVFYKVVGHKKDKYDWYGQNLYETVLPEDYPVVRKALKEAIRCGTSSCEVHNIESGQIFRVTYHLLAKGKSGYTFFTLVEDITDNFRNLMKIQALAELPGTIIYDYDPSTDSMTINVSGKSGYSTIVSESFFSQNAQSKWLAPESEKIYRETFREALSRAMSGSMDFRGRFGSRLYHWYRAYYRSMADDMGRVFRIVGRVDDIEQSAWAGLPYERMDYYDPATQLLTYHALKEFIAEKIGENRSGTMMLLILEGIDEVYRSLGEEMGGCLLREVADVMCVMFRRDDIFGRFGGEGFIIFLPEAHNERLARETAQNIISTVEERVQKAGFGDKVQCNIGIAIAEHEDVTVSELMRRANAALWEGKSEKTAKYVIHEAKPADSIA